MGIVDRALGVIGATMEFIDEHPFIGTSGGFAAGFLIGLAVG